MKSKSGRYGFSGPIKGGDAFWMIDDLVDGYQLVAISIHFPNAERRARELWAELEGK